LAVLALVLPVPYLIHKAVSKARDNHLAAHLGLQAVKIKVTERTTPYIEKGIEPTPQANRIALNIPPDRRLAIAKVVVVQSRLVKGGACPGRFDLCLATSSVMRELLLRVPQDSLLPRSDEAASPHRGHIALRQRSLLPSHAAPVRASL